MHSREYRNRFLVKQGPKLMSVNVSDIAYFYTDGRLNYFKTNDNKKFVIDYSLEELDTMLEVASTLGADWDFIRIDLYAVDGVVWFGEYTPYPGGGLLRYTQRDFDAEQGLHWRLPELEAVRRGQP